VIKCYDLTSLEVGLLLPATCVYPSHTDEKGLERAGTRLCSKPRSPEHEEACASIIDLTRMLSSLLLYVRAEQRACACPRCLGTSIERYSRRGKPPEDMRSIPCRLCWGGWFWPLEQGYGV